MHGNRDFLIGSRFAAATGCLLLGDYETIEVAGERVLLTHGDLLCTDDKPYMALRAVVREPAWQRDFLGKTIDERRAFADDLRDRSRAAIAKKPPEIMDVNQRTVEVAMRTRGVNPPAARAHSPPRHPPVRSRRVERDAHRSRCVVRARQRGSLECRRLSAGDAVALALDCRYAASARAHFAERCNLQSACGLHGIAFATIPTLFRAARAQSRRALAESERTICNRSR